MTIVCIAYRGFQNEIPDLSEELDAIYLLMEVKWIASAIPFDQEPKYRTFPSEQPQRMIDYIFCNENFLKCSDAKILKEAGQI